MIQPTPFNASSPGVCDELYYLDSTTRSPPSAAFTGINIAIFAFSICLWTVSLIWCWRHRLRPYMKTIRPFFANAILAFSSMILSVALSLNLAIPSLPCGVFLAAWFLGFAGCSIHFYITMTIFVLESHFAQHIGKYAATSNRAEDASTVSSPTPGLQETFIFAFISFLKMAVGVRSLDYLSMEELVILKKNYPLIALAIFLPFCIPMAVIFAVQPVYHECSGCALFLEPFLGFIVLYVLYGVAAGRILWVARTARFNDSHGLYYQIMFTLVPAAPLALIVILLTIFDPGNASWNRIFMYFEWLWQLLMHTFNWWGPIGVNRKRVNAAMKKGADTRRVTLASSGKSILQELEQNPEVRGRFEAYAKDHFAVENLYFVEAVRLFKREFKHKNDMGRMLRMKKIMETYIRLGSVMEMNISHGCRQKIIREFEHIRDPIPQEFYNLFDDAVRDINSNILIHMWNQFVMETQFGSKHGQLAASPLNLVDRIASTDEPSGASGDE